MSDPTVSAEALAPRTVDDLITKTEPIEAPPGEEKAPQPGQKQEKPRSLGRDAWEDLRRNPIFIVASILIIFLLIMSFWPGLFTDVDPAKGDAALSRQPPSADAWFGYDVQGRDVYSRTIYGARSSIAVGVATTTFVMLLGGLVGMIAGFYGRWTDAVLSRVGDIFFAIPLLLGAIIVLVSLPNTPETPGWQGIAKVMLALGLLGWPSLARIMRASVIQQKSADYVQAARALGGTNGRIIRKHVLPNSLSPVIIVGMISLGGYIAAEATLSFLGIGLPPSLISWGQAISDAARYIRVSPHMLLFPGAFLSITVLAFIMLGDAVRDAFDPKLR